MKLSVSYAGKKLAFSRLGKTLSSSIAAKKLILSVAVKKLVVALGKFIEIKSFLESINAQDAVAKQIRPNVFEVTYVSDIFSAVYIRNVNVSNTTGAADGEIYFAENYVSDVEKYIEDIQVSWVLYKSFVEPSLIIQDIVGIQYAKGFTERVQVIDFLDGQVSKTDKTLDFFKATDNIPVVSDLFTRVVSFSRSFTETSTASDTATKNLGKIFLESSTATDSFTYVLSISRSFTDDFVATDVSTKTVGKVFTEPPIQRTDVFSRVVSYFRSFAEAPVTTDSAIKDITKVTIETSTTTDSAVKSVAKVVADASAAADAVVKSVAKVIAEASAAADAAIKNTGKTLTEPPRTTDVFSRVVSFSRSLTEPPRTTDVAAKAMAKAFTEPPRTTDTAVKSVGKNSTESSAATDVGSLRAQGYTVDMTYFAEDYVGTSLTFT